MTEDTVRSTINLSNAVLVMLIISEMFIPAIFFQGLLREGLSICCFLIILLFIFFLMGILLIVMMFSSSSRHKHLKTSSNAAAVVNIIGFVLLFGGAPVFILFMLASLYVFIYPLIKEKGISIMLGSIFSFLFGSIGFILPALLFDQVHWSIPFAISIILVIILIGSHILHIYLNKKAMDRWMEISAMKVEPIEEMDKGDTSTEESYWDMVNKDEEFAMEEADIRKKKTGRIPPQEIASEQSGAKPRELRPPPGFTYPSDD